MICFFYNVYAMLCYAKSLQSCPTLCDPIDGSHQAPPSLGLSRQEHWSQLPFPSPTHEKLKVKAKSLSRVRLLATPMDCSLPGSSIYGIFQAKVLEWGAIAFSETLCRWLKLSVSCQDLDWYVPHATVPATHHVFLKKALGQQFLTTPRSPTVGSFPGYRLAAALSSMSVSTALCSAVLHLSHPISILWALQGQALKLLSSVSQESLILGRKGAGYRARCALLRIKVVQNHP